MTSPLPSDRQGFTLPELLIAAAISLLTATVAGDLLISHIRSSERAEAMERQRSDWSRTTTFIEAEVALSERIFDIETQRNITIPAACGFSEGQFRLGLDLRRDLPPVIYAIKPSTTGWLPKNTLWRCGPGLNNDGSYNAALTLAPILDGLDGLPDGEDGFTTSTSPDAKQASFTLALKGHAKVNYSQQDPAHTRISPLYSRPDENLLCGASNLVRLKGSSATADTLIMSIAQVQAGEDILICGEGFLLNGKSEPQNAQGDTITGSDGANDILESGDYGRASLDGKGGNDFLRGTFEADTLNGGGGDDVLVGRDGNDTLNGGSEQNSYLPGAGNDTVNGGPNLDVVFFSGNRAGYTLSGCTKSSCSVTGPDGTDTLKNVEILIFADARVDLPDE